MQQHFSEDVTENITLDGHEVLMCNIPFNQAFIDSKYFNGYGVR